MPTNRSAIRRAPRPARFAPGTVALFIELDAIPLRRRGRQDFKNKEKQLAYKLGLTSEYWTCNGVLDRSAAPCHPEGYIARDHWFRCRAVRAMLLEAAAAASERES